MTEQQIQKKRIKELEAEGYYVIKLMKTNKNGIPDLIAIPPDSGVLFSEVKTKKGVVSELQKYRLLEMETEVAMEIIMTSLEQMRNEIRGHMALALTFNDLDDTPRFIIFKFIELNDREIKLYDYQDISSDTYLDMLLGGELLKTSDSIDTFINY